jgi:predicted amidohydrolase
MRIALLQVLCGFRDKGANYAAVETALKEAVHNRKANLVVLPEVLCFFFLFLFCLVDFARIVFALFFAIGF